MKVWIPEVVLQFREQSSGTVLPVAVSSDPSLVRAVADGVKAEADAVAAKATDPTTATLLTLDAARVKASIDALVPPGVEPVRSGEFDRG